MYQFWEFFGGVFWVFYIEYKSSANSESLTSSLLFWMPFISFCCLIAEVRTSSTMLKNSAKSGHHRRGKALFFPTEYDVSCGFFI